MQSLTVSICEDADDAIRKGHTYQDGFTKLDFENVVVIRRGTVEGHATVDFVFHDEKGNKYVALITGRLLKSIPCWEDHQ